MGDHKHHCAACQSRAPRKRTPKKVKPAYVEEEPDPPVEIDEIVRNTKTLDEILRRLYQIESKDTEIARKLEAVSSRVVSLEKQQKNNHCAEFEGELYGVKKNVEELHSEVQYLHVRTRPKKRSICDQFADAVNSVIGLQEIVKSPYRVERYVWTFLFVLGVVATIYFIVATTAEFLREPTMTKVKLESADLYPYPPLVFCHEAWFDTEKAIALGMTSDSLKYSLGYWRYARQLEISEVMEAKKDFLTTFRRNRFRGLVDYYKAIATDMQAFNDEDEFYNSSVPSYLGHPGEEPAKKIFLPYASFCHAFTIPPADERLGMMEEPRRIILKYQDRADGLLPASQNWMLFISTDPRAMYSWPLSIRPYTQNLLRIQVKRFVSYKSQDSTCREIMEENTNYSSASCMINCQNRHVKDSLSCKIFWIATGEEHEPPEEFCNDFDPLLENSTLQSDLVTARVDLMEKAKEECDKECPRRCDRVLYSVTSSGDGLILKDFRVNKEIDALRRSGSNISMIAAYFNHEAIYHGGVMTATETRAYSFVELVNNIGGTLGLFVGATVMTLVQLITFTVNYFTRRHNQVESTVYRPDV